jgi:hypothetical protein
MRFFKLLVLASFLSAGASLSAQSPAKFLQLQHLGDSAYQAKNYALSIQRYEESLKVLPADQRNDQLPTYYYNLACVYSLSGNINKAVENLDVGFSVMRHGQGAAVNYLRQILQDGDLRNILKTERYQQFLRKNYPSLAKVYSILQYDTLKEISYHDLLKLVGLLKDVDPVQVIIRNKIVFWKKDGDQFRDNPAELPLPDDESLKSAFLIFERCTFRLNFTWNGFSSYEKGNRKIQPFTYRNVFFTGCTFDGPFVIHQVQFEIPPQFSGCTFNDILYIRAFIEPGPGVTGGFRLSHCSVHLTSLSFDGSVRSFANIDHVTSADNSDFEYYAGNVDDCVFTDNLLKHNNTHLMFREMKKLTIERNILDRLEITNTNITTEFDFRKNNLRQLLLYHTYFTDNPANGIDWSTIDGMRLGSTLSYPDGEQDLDEIRGRRVSHPRKIEFISGALPADIADENKYEELLGLYSMFLNLYKAKNYQESYNQCYYAIKELQSKRLHCLYATNRSFETYFRWKLSELLRFYVRHGTDPGRAIIISLNIIALFGVFFFFFPSDWDTTSKTRLVANFKDFIQKNEKGYVKPFFVLLSGFGISLLNALTLSLNAFITLGFGNIPTKGLARYVCVLEGFMGWFLLSIFTVALINQVLQ